MDPRTFAHELLVEYRDEILRVVQDLIRMPSRNMPPGGEELACQEYLAGYLRRAGLTVDLYEPDQAPGLVEPGLLARPRLLQPAQPAFAPAGAGRRPVAAPLRPCRYRGAGRQRLDLPAVRR